MPHRTAPSAADPILAKHTAWLLQDLAKYGYVYGNHYALAASKAVQATGAAVLAADGYLHGKNSRFYARVVRETAAKR